MSDHLPENASRHADQAENPTLSPTVPEERLDDLSVEVVIDDGVILPVAEATLISAVHQAFLHRGFSGGEVGIRISDDAGIHEINRRHLQHDYATDVISFTYDCQQTTIEGDLIVSVDTAARRGAEIGWPAACELLLYVIHGSLHLTGMEDTQPQQRTAMRKAEREVLRCLGIDQSDRFAADTISEDESDHAEVTSDQHEQ